MFTRIDHPDPDTRRRIDSLLRSVMIPLFIAGAVAIVLLWLLETRSGVIDAGSAVAYPVMLTVFLGCAAMLRRWPQTTRIARWAGVAAINGFIVVALAGALGSGAPLIGNYAFVSLLMWLPLAYAIALFMLDARHALWAVSALFGLIALVSLVRVFFPRNGGGDDTMLLVNLLASHVVLLACLSGLLRFKSVLVQADARSRHLFEQATSDPLTGLANRRLGLTRLEAAALGHSRAAAAGLILCDIDYFKDINDRHGHDAGDKVVLAVSGVLRNNVRDVDTVVRWGGDEFLIVVPGVGHPALLEMADRLRASMAATEVFDQIGDAIRPTLSLGVAVMAEGENGAAWIRRADQALYKAKAAGRDQCVFASPEAPPLPESA